MSAFIVSHDHIDALVTFAALHRVNVYREGKRLEIRTQNAEEIGRILLDENVRSVCERYGSGISAAEKNAAATYRFRMFLHVPAVAIAKACDCFDYQACETDDYETTLAAAIIREIRAAAIRALPGYEQAAWEITRSNRVA